MDHKRPKYQIIQSHPSLNIRRRETRVQRTFCKSDHCDFLYFICRAVRLLQNIAAKLITMKVSRCKVIIRLGFWLNRHHIQKIRKAEQWNLTDICIL
jgi:hypothetical protein